MQNPNQNHNHNLHNVILYRRNGNNALHLFGFWDGFGCLEVYRTPDDTQSSLISLDIIKDKYIYWYDCKKAKPVPTNYKLVVLKNIMCPVTNKAVLKVGDKFTGFELRFSPL